MHPEVECVPGALMPRTNIEPQFTVEHLSVLDADGNLDSAVEPPIPPDELKRLYRSMVLARRFDERMLRLQRQGRIGTFAPIKGQEAAQLGSVATLRRTDWMVPSFRETASMLWRGWPMEKILLFFAGYLEGGQPTADQHDLPVCIPVSTQLPHAVGLASAAPYRGDDAVVMVYCGDGATSEGDFHEAMNFAGVWHVPVVFVIQNNQWAISIPLKKQTNSRTTAQKALAYGFPGIQVDGNDVLAVYAASQEAVGRARQGNGPTLVECVTYRLGVHTTSDDPTKYRSAEEGASGGGGVGAEGSAHPLQRIPAEARSPRARPRGAGRPGDRRRGPFVRGDRRRRSLDDVRPCLRGAIARAGRAAGRDAGPVRALGGRAPGRRGSRSRGPGGRGDRGAGR